MEVNDLKKIAYQIINDKENSVVVFTAINNGKPNICVAVSKDLIESKGLNAGNIVRELAKEIQGGGGGQANLATAGGKNTDALPNVLAKINSIIAEL